MTKITRVKGPFEGMDLVVAMEYDAYILSHTRLKFFAAQFNRLAYLNQVETLESINKVALTVMRMMQPPEVHDTRDDAMLLAIAHVCGRASVLRPKLNEVIWSILDEDESFPMEIITTEEATNRIQVYRDDDYDPNEPDTLH